MKETDIRKYAGLMQELGLTGLEITEGEEKVRLERTAAPRETSSSAISASAMSAPVTEPAAVGEDYISVKSPIVGVFYSSPAENSEPYVTVGDCVKKGQVLCIIEAMKLMNEITAETDGEILEICAANGQVVEFGTELFRIRR